MIELVVMNHYHTLINVKSRTNKDEPRWVTRCLDGFDLEIDEGRKKMEENVITKLFNKLSFTLKRDKSLGKKKSVEIANCDEQELRTEAEKIYNEILDTVNLNTPSMTLKRVNMSKGEKLETPGPEFTPKSILRRSCTASTSTTPTPSIASTTMVGHLRSMSPRARKMSSTTPTPSVASTSRISAYHHYQHSGENIRRMSLAVPQKYRR